MAKFCTNCGTQNPDSNNFCQKCGSQLPAPIPEASSAGAATTPAPPPAVAPAPAQAVPPPPASPASPAPVYVAQTPPGGGPPPGRLSRGVIIGGIIGALVLLSVLGVAGAAALKPSVKPSPTPATSPTATNPSPTPTNAPPPPPPPPPNGAVVTDVDNIRVTAPADWKVVSTKPYKIALSNGKGLVRFFSLKMSPAQTVEQLLQGDLAEDVKIDPNAKVCNGPGAHALAGASVPGTFATICYIDVPQQGPSYPAQDIWIEAVSADGSTEFAMNFFASNDNISAFLNAIDAAGIKVTWKLPQ